MKKDTLKFKIILKLFMCSFLFYACESKLEKASGYIEVGKLTEAKNTLKEIDTLDIDFNKAQSLLGKIDSLEIHQNFKEAKEAFQNEEYYKTQTLLDRLINDSIDNQEYKLLYDKSETELQKRKALRNQAKKKRELEKLKAEKERKIQEDIEYKRLKIRVQELYDELMSFKDNKGFHEYGFGVAYKYKPWQVRVGEVSNHPLSKRLLLQDNISPGVLAVMGLDYMKSKGKETEYTRWAKKEMLHGIAK